MFKKTLVIILLAFLALIVFYYFLFNENVPTDYQMADEIVGSNKQIIYINKIAITIEIADEPNEQSRGLSGRDSLEENGGMLFVFPESEKYSFWMKEMRFSLDLIWIDENKIITDITKNVSPDTFPATFSPSSPVKYVLEVNAGWSDRHNIKVGNIVSF